MLVRRSDPHQIDVMSIVRNKGHRLSAAVWAEVDRHIDAGENNATISRALGISWYSVANRRKGRALGKPGAAWTVSPAVLEARKSLPRAKRRAEIVRLLSDPAMATVSDRQIAKRVGISPSAVGIIRRKIAPSVTEPWTRGEGIARRLTAAGKAELSRRFAAGETDAEITEAMGMRQKTVRARRMRHEIAEALAERQRVVRSRRKRHGRWQPAEHHSARLLA